MKNEIPTAEEFMLSNLESMDQREVEMVMIEFAKLHVKAALETAAKKATIEYDQFDDMAAYVNNISILNAYPDENII